MDYRDLLKRYVEHVTDCEGTSFLHDTAKDAAADGLFTEAEWTELESIRDLAYADIEARKAERLARWKAEEPQRILEAERIAAAEKARRNTVRVIK